MPNHHPGQYTEEHPQRPWCSKCHTDEHLIIDSIEPLKPPRPGLLAVAYTCIECDFFYAHTTSTTQLAAILDRP